MLAVDVGDDIYDNYQSGAGGLKIAWDAGVDVITGVGGAVVSSLAAAGTTALVGMIVGSAGCPVIGTVAGAVVGLAAGFVYNFAVNANINGKSSVEWAKSVF